jgi:hypothetical protein
MNSNNQPPSSASFGFMYGEQGWQDVVNQGEKKAYSSSQATVGLVSLASISPTDSEFSMDTSNLSNSWNTQDTYSVDGSIQDATDVTSPVGNAQDDSKDR